MQEITLDNWKPQQKVKKIPQGLWRKKEQRGKKIIQPSLDDVRKIKFYMRKGYSDKEIITNFKITPRILTAIKKNLYCPAQGILPTRDEELSKITKRRQQKKDEKVRAAQRQQELCPKNN